MKFTLDIAGEEIERMTELTDSMDKKLAKTLKDNHEMSLSMESFNGSGRRKSCPGGDGIPLSEVRKIFLERNDLKYQLEIVRQKLDSLKKEIYPDKSTPQIPTIDSKCIQTDESRGRDRNDGKEEEESVQGPINREPLEKIFFSNRSKSLR